MITRDEVILTEEEKCTYEQISKEGRLWCTKQFNEEKIKMDGKE